MITMVSEPRFDMSAKETVEKDLFSYSHLPLLSSLSALFAINTERRDTHVVMWMVNILLSMQNLPLPLPLHEIRHRDHGHQHNEKEDQKLIDIFFTGTDFTSHDATVHGQFGVLSGVHSASNSPFGVLDS